MPVSICPHCSQRFVYNSYDKDYVHKCNSPSAAINNDDVVVMGDYVDEVTNELISKPNALLQGAANKLYGKTRGLEGDDLESETSNGNRESTHRQRQHYQQIDL